MHDGMNVDDLADQLSDDRWEVALRRASNKLGRFPSDEHDDEFNDALVAEVRKMIATDITDELTARGLVVPYVDEDGDLRFNLTEAGERELSPEE
jgi:hypothetical protein